MRYIALLLVLFYSEMAICTIINIPADKPDIQSGIDSANPGDTVLVAPGTYKESINLSISSLTLASWYLTTADETYIDRTILDGMGQASVITINDPSSEAVLIAGFTIQNGDDGIYADARFQIFSCQITGCNDGIDYESGSGGICKFNTFQYNADDGIDLDGTIDILIENNVVADNEDDGIEIRLHEYTGETVHNIIRNNQIHGNGEDGIQLIDYPDSSSRMLLIERNIIYNNAMAGIGCMSDGNTEENYEGAPIPEPIYLFNNTIDDNNYGITGGRNLVSLNNIITNCHHTAAKNVTWNSIIMHCLFHGNGLDTVNCNIDGSMTIFNDPRFDNDYSLSGDSPCIDAGTSFFTWNSDTVLNLSPNDYVGSNPDIGAREREFTASDRIIDPENEIKIYPNPNNGMFWMELCKYNNSMKGKIYNSAGQMLNSLNINEMKTLIDLSSYPTGLYILSITEDKSGLPNVLPIAIL